MLIGLTKKTATNLGIKVADYPAVFDDVMADIEEAANPIAARPSIGLAAMVRHCHFDHTRSQKARIGKSLEVSIARAALTCIGLNEEQGISGSMSRPTKKLTARPMRKCEPRGDSSVSRWA